MRLANDQAFQAAFGITTFQVDCRMAGAIVKCRQIACQLQRAGGAHRVADEALGVVKSRAAATAKDAAQGFALLCIARCRAGGVRADDVDVVGRDTRAAQRGLKALGLAFGIGQHEIAGVAVDGPADDFAVDFRAAVAGIAHTLQHIHAAAFGHHDAGAVGIERARGFGRIVVRGQRALGFEAGENAEGVNAFRNAAGQGDIAFAQQQHLRALNHPGVARRAGGADRVVRSGDAQVQRDLAGRIVGHRARVVVVRPELGVVIERFELEDFVFGLDVAVFGDADVNADISFVDIGPIESGVGHGFARTVNADAAGTRAAAHFLLRLVAKFVEIADAGDRGADVADVVGTDAACAGQQIRAKIRQVIGAWRGEANSSDSNSLTLGPGNHRRLSLPSVTLANLST